MNEQNPDRTLPPVPKPTETQRFQPPVVDDLEKTSPHIVVGTFPRSSGKTPDLPPGLSPEVGGEYEYGGMKLHDVVHLENGDIEGTDENGIRFVVPADTVKEYKK